GLPIPHTAIIPENKARIGRNLANFICDHFLATPQVLAKLRAADPALRLARWLARPAQAGQLGALAAVLLRYGLTAFDDERVRAFLARAAGAGLAQLDFSRLAGRVLEALTADGRHQALLDDLLGRTAALLDDEQLQEQL